MSKLTPFQRKRLDQLSYTILPGKPDPGFAEPTLHNNAYAYWRDFWKQIYTDSGSPESFQPEEFFRQDFIATLHEGDRIAGLHLYTLFRLDLMSAQEHRYFKMYSDKFFGIMSARGCKYAMSVEFLTIDPAWRAKESGISMAKVLIGCSQRFFEHVPIDAIIAPARTDNKVNTMAYELGFECVEAKLQRRGFEVDTVAAFPNGAKMPSDPDVAHYIEKHWAQREDWTGRTRQIPDRQIKIAA